MGDWVVRPLRRTGGLLGLVLLMMVTSCGKESQLPAEGEEQGETQPEFEESFLGYLSKTYEGSHDRCAAATRSALEKLELKVVNESGDMFGRTFEAEGGDVAIVVELAPVSKTSTQVSVKVGYLFGDKTAAQRDRRPEGQVEAHDGRPEEAGARPREGPRGLIGRREMGRRRRQVRDPSERYGRSGLSKSNPKRRGSSPITAAEKIFST